MVWAMRAEHTALREAIRKREYAAACLFSVCEPFSRHLARWRDDILPDKYDHNAFEVHGLPDEAEIEAACAAQKERGLNYLKLETDEPIPPALLSRCGLTESCTLTMAFTGDRSGWKRNDAVAVYELGERDFADELLRLELSVFGPQFGEDFTRRNLLRYLEEAGKRGPFHYFGAWEGDRFAGGCYAIADNGWLGLDGLVVTPELRNRSIATTMMASVLERFEPVSVYLHADRDDTPRKMYARMGFETVDVLFEYLTRW